MSEHNRPALALRPAVIVVLITLCGSTGLISGCSSARLLDSTVVEGVVTVRGNVPFNAPILETDGRNYYVLVLTPEQRRRLTTPRRYRVTGRIYVDDWNGRPFAHFDVRELTALDS